MKVEKIPLDDMPMPYAVGAFAASGVAGVAFASEQRDGPCRLHFAGGGSEAMWTVPGGVMNVVQDGEAPAVWAIQNFFPVFQSEGACIVRMERAAPGQWRQTHSVPLPYVHRIAHFRVGGRPHLLACTLCAQKSFEQDWSSPGSVYIAPLVPGREVEFRVVATGLFKNHGLTILQGGSEVSALVSSSQGVLRIDFSGAEPPGWRTKTLLDREASEAVLFDLDADGQDELVTIEGFHGDSLRVYRDAGAAWACVAEFPLAFGHVLWAGTILGRRCILTASRGGDKDTVLHFPGKDLAKPWTEERVDAGVGATQILVRESAGAAWLYAANHGEGRAVAYRLEDR